MTLIVNLTPAEESRLKKAAKDKDVQPEELARQLIANLPGTEPGPHARASDELRAMGREALREHSRGPHDEYERLIG